jgi:hypothetical protein
MVFQNEAVIDLDYLAFGLIEIVDTTCNLTVYWYLAVDSLTALPPRKIHKTCIPRNLHNKMVMVLVGILIAFHTSVLVQNL